MPSSSQNAGGFMTDLSRLAIPLALTAGTQYAREVSGVKVPKKKSSGSSTTSKKPVKKTSKTSKKPSAGRRAAYGGSGGGAVAVEGQESLFTGTGAAVAAAGTPALPAVDHFTASSLPVAQDAGIVVPSSPTTMDGGAKKKKKSAAKKTVVKKKAAAASPKKSKKKAHKGGALENENDESAQGGSLRLWGGSAEAAKHAAVRNAFVAKQFRDLASEIRSLISSYNLKKSIKK